MEAVLTSSRESARVLFDFQEVPAMPFTKLLLFFSVGCALIGQLLFVPVYSAGVVNTKAVVARGAKLIKEQKYNEATALFSKAAKAKPKSVTLQYYLGMSYLYSRNTAAAERALSKAIVASNPNSTMNKRALDLLYRYKHVKPYSCMQQYLKPPRLVRWSKRKMPLTIYVSDGKLIPKLFDDAVLDTQECIQIGRWARQPSFISRLKTSNLYKPAHKQAVMEGVRRWRWAEQEKILSFRFTNDATKADILVFWCHKLRGFGAWTYHPQLVPGVALPSIIFMSLESCNGSDDKRYTDSFTQITTHELGHAIGLEHSPYEEDLMFHSARKNFSKGDKATIRALYSLPADYTFLSVSKK